MAELSPAAQVMVAVTHIYQEHAGEPPARAIAAAALRAAVDEVISSVPPPCEDYDEYAQGFLSAHAEYRQKLLAIVDELKAHA